MFAEEATEEMKELDDEGWIACMIWVYCWREEARDDDAVDLMW